MSKCNEKNISVNIPAHKEYQTPVMTEIECGCEGILCFSHKYDFPLGDWDDEDVDHGGGAH